jgi:pimeloyl-ACP methyl ester carboxylesterase
MPSFTSFDGLEIAYQEWKPETGQSSAGTLPPVVLHHGFIADANLNWVGPGVVTALERAGRHVFALDARGHGASQKPHDPRFYGEGTMSRDLLQLVGLTGAPQVDLVGYSMGAVVSLIAASQDARVRRLVVGGIGGSLVEHGTINPVEASRRAVADAMVTSDPASITDPVGVRFRAFADMVGADREAMAASASAVHVGSIPFGQITAPTLVIAGDQDAIAARPEVLVAAIPQARLLLIPGDHLTVVGDPRFAPAIVDFLMGP